MPTRLALTGFMHGSQKFKRNEPVTFDARTIEALQRAGLVGKEDRPDLAPPAVAGGDDTFLQDNGTETPNTAKPSVTAPKAKAQKPGKKSSASPAVPASLPPTLPPLQPGVPPPLPDVK